MIKLGNLSIGLGSAGGLLLTGITIGYVRSMRPTFAGVPPAALKILTEVGLTLFMAGVGLRAGAGIVEGFKSAHPHSTSSTKLQKAKHPRSAMLALTPSPMSYSPLPALL